MEQEYGSGGGSLKHLFVTVFLYNFAVFMVIPAITDVTMSALCPGKDECSLAIYLSGFQQAVTGLGSLMVMPVVGNLSDTYGRKALLTFPMTLTILPLGILACGRTRYFFYSYYILKTLTAMFCDGSVQCLALAYVNPIPYLETNGFYEKRRPYIVDLIGMAHPKYSGPHYGPAGLIHYHQGLMNRNSIAQLVPATTNLSPATVPADNKSESQRASAFGLLSGVSSAAFVCGTLASRFLSTISTFQVSAFVAMLATLYMKFFLKDSNFNSIDASTRLLSSNKESTDIPSDEKSRRKVQIGKRIPSVDDMIHLLRSSLTFTQAAVVAFFNNLADGGLHGSLLYFLKARFQFNKNQFADLFLIAGFAGAISQLLLMPKLAPRFGEEKLLKIGLFAGVLHILLYSISWAHWVPYVATMFSILGVFAYPCIRSIASKQVGPEEQGKAQGCISGICSFANIISPLVFTPLTALFLSEAAPFNFPGFSIMCMAFSLMVAFIQSLLIRSAPPIASQKTSSNTYTEA